MTDESLYEDKSYFTIGVVAGAIVLILLACTFGVEMAPDMARFAAP